jgi:hypothetical protein
MIWVLFDMHMFDLTCCVQQHTAKPFTLQAWQGARTAEIYLPDAGRPAGQLQTAAQELAAKAGPHGHQQHNSNWGHALAASHQMASYRIGTCLQVLCTSMHAYGCLVKARLACLQAGAAICSSTNA